MKKMMIWVGLGMILTFLFCGNARAGTWWPVPSYDSQNNRYLLVYQETPLYNSSISEIYGVFINPDTYNYEGKEFVISNQGMRPSVAYDSNNHRFLVVWEGGGTWGQLVNSDGTLIGANFYIGPGGVQPKVAYDNVSQRFLVVFTKDLIYPGDWYSGDVYGQLVNIDGTLFPNNNPSTDNFIISNADYGQGYPDLAFDSINRRFLVAWLDYRSGTRWDIYGQLVNNDGTLYNTAANINFIISNVYYNRYITIAYENVNQRFLVAWPTHISDYNDHIYGQLINADGTLYPNNNSQTDNFVISDKINPKNFVSSAYDIINQRFLVVFGRWGIEGQLVNADATLYRTASDVNFSIASGRPEPYGENEVFLAYNSNSANFLTAYCYVLNSEGIGAMNYAPAPSIYSVSGRITRFVWPLRDVTVSLVDIGNDNFIGSYNILATTPTDIKGNYTFSNRLPGKYMVAPCKKNYSFVPASRNTLVLDDDIPNQNFTASLAPYTISGKVTTSAGRVFSGVTVTLTGGTCTYTATTNFYGYYPFRVPDGNYRLTASKTGYAFTPAFIDVTVNGGNQTGKNFRQQ